MKIKFIDQQYQTDAVNSIVDILEGSNVKSSEFTIDMSQNHQGFLPDAEGVTYQLGFSNELQLDESELLENVRKIQEKNGILKSTNLQNKNFTIEMETGTGKTYVYTKTILELNKKYGFTKFIIVVPSIAIREGTYKSIQLTKEHFDLKYGNPIYNTFIYDSSKLDQVQSFAMSSNIEIMIINIASFNRSFTNIDDLDNKANIIHRESDRLSGNKPIDLIASTNPVVIIDEPQSVDNTKKSKAAIKSLNPLFTLRYSATHRETYNLMYRLTPVDAYQQNLVKKIEVSGITNTDISTKPYIRLISTTKKNGFSASVEINVKQKNGNIKKVSKRIKTGHDLWELSNELEAYDGGFILDNIGADKDNEFISFTNGDYLEKGQIIGGVDPDTIKRAQIRETINLHLAKEAKLTRKGIKVLSLFFIDQVDNYRQYDEDNKAIKGKYAKWFEEEFENAINTQFKWLKDKYKDVLSFEPKEVHDGYFSVDRQGKIKNTRGESQDDQTTYELIMKNKERLLSFDEPTRFIFSHSALKEGWDNPNVFQVCTLVETRDTLTKRQKIGRGLRICVNQDGERVNDPNINLLSVVANESYSDFAKGLQKEFIDAGYEFGVVKKTSFSNITIEGFDCTIKELNQDESLEIFNYLVSKNYLSKRGKVKEEFFKDVAQDKFTLPDKFLEYEKDIIKRIEFLSREVEIKDRNERQEVKINEDWLEREEFLLLWDKIKRKTIYKIEMNLESFKRKAIEEVKNMRQIRPIRLSSVKAQLDITEGGIKEESAVYKPLDEVSEFERLNFPDFIRRLQDSTNLLRKTIIEIISKSNTLEYFYNDPEEYIKEVTRILNHVKENHISKGLKYYQSDEYFIVEEIFDNMPIYGHIDKDIVEAQGANLYSHIKFDSNIEKEFGLSADVDDDVKFYTKLPSSFKIDTPFGKYNPDWAIVVNDSQGDKVYFVVETKGTRFKEDQRTSEILKIESAIKHFDAVNSEIRYEVTDDFKNIKKDS